MVNDFFPIPTVLPKEHRGPERNPYKQSDNGYGQRHAVMRRSEEVKSKTA
jgi:hypothetical protein